MSSYTFKRNQIASTVQLILDSCEGGIYNKSEITINYDKNVATLFYPSSHGINDREYFTNSQSINRPTTKITNVYIVTILKNKLFDQFTDDDFMRLSLKVWKKDQDYRNDYVKFDLRISSYFRLLDEWYEEIVKLTKIPRYIWWKTIDNKITINYTDFKYIDCKKYVLTPKELEIEGYGRLEYEGGVIYGNHPIIVNNLSRIDYFEYISILNIFPGKLWNSEFIPDVVSKSKNIIMIDSRSIEEIELIIRDTFNRVCEDVSKGIFR